MMCREEDLARRLCGYLGLTVKTMRGSIVIYPSDADWNKDIVDEQVYETFHDVLFGELRPFISLCNVFRWKIHVPAWDDVVRRAFPFSSLDELELQLSVRGF